PAVCGLARASHTALGDADRTARFPPLPPRRTGARCRTHVADRTGRRRGGEGIRRVEEAGVFPVAVDARETGRHGRRGVHGEEFWALRRVARELDAGSHPRLTAGGRFLPIR